MKIQEADRARLHALINGAFAADEGGNVAVTVRDLRWLVCLVDSLIWEIELLQQPVHEVPSQNPIAIESPEANEGSHERESE